MPDQLPDKPRRSTRTMVIYALAIFTAGIVFSLMFSMALEATNTTEFCTSCHTMKINLEELKKTAHYSHRIGVRLGCADCHVPKQLGPKLWAKIMAAKDVYHEVVGTISTPEKYEARRWQMANAVWDKMKATDSRECRNCHSWEAMKLEDQDGSARKKHLRAMEEGKTCIECHKGIAHKEPEEPEDKKEEPKKVSSDDKKSDTFEQKS